MEIKPQTFISDIPDTFFISLKSKQTDEDKKIVIQMIIDLKEFFSSLSLIETLIVCLHLQSKRTFREIGEDGWFLTNQPVTRQGVHKIYKRGIDNLIRCISQYNRFDEIYRALVIDYVGLYVGLGKIMNERNYSNG